MKVAACVGGGRVGLWRAGSGWIERRWTGGGWDEGGRRSCRKEDSRGMDSWRIGGGLGGGERQQQFVGGQRVDVGLIVGLSEKGNEKIRGSSCLDQNILK